MRAAPRFPPGSTEDLCTRTFPTRCNHTHQPCGCDEEVIVTLPRSGMIHAGPMPNINPVSKETAMAKSPVRSAGIAQRPQYGWVSARQRVTLRLKTA